MTDTKKTAASALIEKPTMGVVPVMRHSIGMGDLESRSFPFITTKHVTS